MIFPWLSISLTSTQLTEQQGHTYTSSQLVCCLWVCTGITQRKETNAIVCIVSISFVSIVSPDFEERRQVKWSPLCVLAIPPRRWRVRTIRQNYPSCVFCSLINPAAFALVSGGSGHEPDVTLRDPLPLTRNARVITWPTMLCWCRANER